MPSYSHKNRKEPRYIADPDAWGGTVTSSTTAVTVLTATGKTARVETWIAYNGHTAAVDVEFIRDDNGTERILYKATALAAGATIEMLAAINSEPEKRFLIVPDGHSLKYRVTTSVANPVTADLQGGWY